MCFGECVLLTLHQLPRIRKIRIFLFQNSPRFSASKSDSHSKSAIKMHFKAWKDTRPHGTLTWWSGDGRRSRLSCVLCLWVRDTATLSFSLICTPLSKDSGVRDVMSYNGCVIRVIYRPGIQYYRFAWIGGQIGAQSPLLQWAGKCKFALWFTQT